jgi:hypothetical protein
MATAPENWETIKRLFEAALEQNADQRSSFLRNHCPDATIRAEVGGLDLPANRVLQTVMKL